MFQEKRKSSLLNFLYLLFLTYFNAYTKSLVSQTVTKIKVQPPEASYILAESHDPSHSSTFTFLELVKQRNVGNKVEQCPCVVLAGSDKCIVYDARFQAANLEEAILTFIDTSMDPRIFEQRSGGAPISATTFTCPTEECRQCAAMIALRLRQIGLLNNNLNFPFALPTETALRFLGCPRIRISRNVPDFDPPTNVPDYLESLIVAGAGRRANLDQLPKSKFAQLVDQAVRDEKNSNGRPLISQYIAEIIREKNWQPRPPQNNQPPLPPPPPLPPQNTNRQQQLPQQQQTILQQPQTTPNRPLLDRFRNTVRNFNNQQFGDNIRRQQPQQSSVRRRQWSSWNQWSLPSGSAQQQQQQQPLQQVRQRSPQPKQQFFPQQEELNGQFVPQKQNGQFLSQQQNGQFLSQQQNGQFVPQQQNGQFVPQQQQIGQQEFFPQQFEQQFLPQQQQGQQQGQQQFNQLPQQGQQQFGQIPQQGQQQQFGQMPQQGQQQQFGQIPQQGQQQQFGQMPQQEQQQQFGQMPQQGQQQQFGQLPQQGQQQQFGQLSQQGVEFGQQLGQQITRGIDSNFNQQQQQQQTQKHPYNQNTEQQQQQQQQFLPNQLNNNNNNNNFSPNIMGGLRKTRSKRASNERIIGDRFVISCVARGDSENEDTEFLNLCTACWTWRQLPEDYFPRLLNELVCQENDYCLSGWGECHQRYRNVDILQRVGNDWRTTTISTASCCDCKVKAGSEIHKLVTNKK